MRISRNTERRKRRRTSAGCRQSADGRVAVLRFPLAKMGPRCAVVLHQKGHDGEPGAWKDAGDTRPLPSFTSTDGRSVCLYCWARACFTLFGQNDLSQRAGPSSRWAPVHPRAWKRSLRTLFAASCVHRLCRGPVATVLPIGCWRRSLHLVANTEVRERDSNKDRRRVTQGLLTPL